MSKILNLEHHFCITSSRQVAKITKPLTDAFGILHFRYLKLYHDGSRILLTNRPDCVRFMYGTDQYKEMWFDGEFPNHLSNGWHLWDALRSVSANNTVTPLEMEINHLLNLFHGLTLVFTGTNFYEIFTFDSNHPNIYKVNRNFFLRFVYYFKQQAADLIKRGERERLILSLKPAEPQTNSESDQLEKINNFLNVTDISRYYLSGKYDHVYLTKKEIRCVYWLLKGKSAEEIASIEGNTKKTVQSHFEKIREKLDCYKQTQIIPIILESGILDTYLI